MDKPKTKFLKNIEEKMQDLEEGSLRYRVLESAKNFKTSWIELGQSLYSAHKDKLYKEWGYTTFEVYVAKEIGIRKDTAMKLLRSYYFLEREEPDYLRKEYRDSATAAAVPSYESVELLRNAKSKKVLDEKDYAHIKKDIFEKGRDPRDVKKDLTALIRQRQELEPQEAWEKRKFSAVRRLIGTLRALKSEIETSKLLPMPLMKETEKLIEKLEQEIS
jgi:hypothetical protein